MEREPVGKGSIGFVRRELEKIGVALRRPDLDPERRAKLYAAQQALSWAVDPDQFASPLQAILRDAVATTAGTRAD